MKNTLLYPINGAMGLFFPFDTCSHKSKWCDKYCYQKKEEFPRNEHRWSTLKFFITKTPQQIVNKIIKELNGKILHWFVSGDCWSPKFIYQATSHNEKVDLTFANIIYLLDKKGIKQCGFTRNLDLWLLVPDILIYSKDPNYTIKKDKTLIAIKEKDKEIISLVKEHNLRFCVPKQSTSKDDCGVDIFRYRIKKETEETVDAYQISSGCGPSIKYRKKIKHFEGTKVAVKANKDCAMCLKKKKGCFNRNKFIINNNAPFPVGGTLSFDCLEEPVIEKLLNIGMNSLTK